jgi:diaminohydroxyphosphoribosylaminopyrimidine deaminase/5-amino-6-(5-phosphoribosylamino)uracil reductase
MDRLFTKRMLDLAARVAYRATGLVEPNPLVGCVIADERSGEVIGIGHHRRYGGPHAEREAIADARRRGLGARLAGAAAFVTLEPCNAHGKQPPCVEALLEARIPKVVMARHDPNPAKAGGAERLRAAGVEVVFSSDSPAAWRLAEPFVKRLTTGLPWVIAKWAQTIDGRTATRTGESQWISGEQSRRRVHQLRGRVDAILVGMGTVRADDPRLTARGVAVRRRALRVVLDPRGELTGRERVLEVGEGPDAAATAVVTGADREPRLPAGVVIMREPVDAAGRLDLTSVLRRLHAERGVSTVLVEGGAGLVGGLLEADLIDEAHVYVGPTVLGDDAARGAAAGREAPRLSDGRAMRLISLRRSGGGGGAGGGGGGGRGGDARLVYRRERGA